MIYRLSDSLTGKRYKIVAVNLTEKQTAKLDKLGIFPGETVTITKKIFGTRLSYICQNAEIDRNARPTKNVFL